MERMRELEDVDELALVAAATALDGAEHLGTAAGASELGAAAVEGTVADDLQQETTG